MTPFQLYGVVLVLVWLLIVLGFYRHSTAALAVGLIVVGLYTLAAIVNGGVSLDGLGLGAPYSWLATAGFAAVGLALMLAYSPLADRIATRWAPKPPTLDDFRPLQRSTGRLAAGIAATWVFGGFLEELVARGIILLSIKALLSGWISPIVAAAIAAVIAALGAGLMHAYQGPRAVLIITQISILFGVLFIASGYNLWAVILCHGAYDTVAFIRFANKKSKYSKEPSPNLPQNR